MSKEKVREYEKETKENIPERVKKAKDAKSKSRKFMRSQKAKTQQED